MDTELLKVVGPVIVLLALGIVAAVFSRRLKLSPVVGYIVLGIALKAIGLKGLADSSAVATLSTLGVVFLLFDIGLHFSPRQIREEAHVIFGFGPVQVLFATVALGLVTYLSGASPVASLIVGLSLALSSTAVVARLIAERHQQSCPVGVTAEGILIFQDVAAILLLVVAGALGQGLGQLLPVTLIAIAKAVVAFGIAIVAAKYLVRPIFDIVARYGVEEVFTATALFIALGTGWLAGMIGLSMSLGAFLGGVTLAETPYRFVIAAEIKPFRGLLMGILFLSVGISIDIDTVLGNWGAVALATIALIVVKTLSNMAASLTFRWSVPGSIQLGFLLAQGSELSFVVLSIPAVRSLVGQDRSSVAITAVAATLALTPAIADLGRFLASRIRKRTTKVFDAELHRRGVPVPVVIVGMGRRGRMLADCLTAFGVEYQGIERDQQALGQALADGYQVVFGDAADPRLWGTLSAHDKRVSVLTNPSTIDAEELRHFAGNAQSNVKHVAVVKTQHQAERLKEIGLTPKLIEDDPYGFELSNFILTELGVSAEAMAEWREKQRARITTAAPGARTAIAPEAAV